MNAYDGVTQLTSTLIGGTTKILLPQTIKFTSLYANQNLSYMYDGTSSGTLDSKYTKLANNGRLSVKATKTQIITDLGVKWHLVSVAAFFGD